MREVLESDYFRYDATQRKYIRVNSAIDLLVYLSELSDLECPVDSLIVYHTKELEKALKKYLVLVFPNGLKEVEALKAKREQEEKKRIALMMKKRQLLDELEKIGDI